MRIEVITGPAMSGKTTKLRAIQERLKADGLNVPLLVGTDLHSPRELMRALIGEIEKGHRVVLADDCSLDQIRAVITWRKENPAGAASAGAVIHLAKQA